MSSGGKREGAGRKTLHKGKKTVSVTLTPEIWQRVAEKAKEQKISRSDLIQTILEKSL